MNYPTIHLVNHLINESLFYKGDTTLLNPAGTKISWLKQASCCPSCWKEAQQKVTINMIIWIFDAEVCDYMLFLFNQLFLDRTGWQSQSVARPDMALQSKCPKKITTKVCPAGHSCSAARRSACEWSTWSALVWFFMKGAVWINLE